MGTDTRPVGCYFWLLARDSGEAWFLRESQKLSAELSAGQAVKTYTFLRGLDGQPAVSLGWDPHQELPTVAPQGEGLWRRLTASGHFGNGLCDEPADSLEGRVRRLGQPAQ